jgi:hypothetical protein
VAIQTTTGMGIGQPPVKMPPIEVDCLVQSIFQLREATKKTEATEKMTLLSLRSPVQNFMALG